MHADTYRYDEGSVLRARSTTWASCQIRGLRGASASHFLLTEWVSGPEAAITIEFIRRYRLSLLTVLLACTGHRLESGTPSAPWKPGTRLALDLARRASQPRKENGERAFVSQVGAVLDEYVQSFGGKQSLGSGEHQLAYEFAILALSESILAHFPNTEVAKFAAVSLPNSRLSVFYWCHEACFAARSVPTVYDAYVHGRRASAEKALRKYDRASYGRVPGLCFMRAVFCLRAGQLREAEELTQSGLARFSPKSPPATAKVLLLLAQEQLSKLDYEGAETALRLVVASHPKIPEAVSARRLAKQLAKIAPEPR